MYITVDEMTKVNQDSAWQWSLTRQGGRWISQPAHSHPHPPSGPAIASNKDHINIDQRFEKFLNLEQGPIQGQRRLLPDKHFSTVEWAGVIKPPQGTHLRTEWSHVCSVIETRKSKATMPKDNSSFSELPPARFEPVTFCVLGRHSNNWATKVRSSAGQAESYSREKVSLTW